jgi:hypothetical protein
MLLGIWSDVWTAKGQEPEGKKSFEECFGGGTIGALEPLELVIGGGGNAAMWVVILCICITPSI